MVLKKRNRVIVITSIVFAVMLFVVVVIKVSRLEYASEGSISIESQMRKLTIDMEKSITEYGEGIKDVSVYIDNFNEDNEEIYVVLLMDEVIANDVADFEIKKIVQEIRDIEEKQIYISSVNIWDEK